MAAEHRRGRSQQGETLIESLVAITILSLVAAASFLGMRTALGSSAQHHEGAVAETLLRSAAERVQDPTSPYLRRAGCGGTATYADLPTRPGYRSIDVTVRFWTAPAPPAASDTSPVPVEFSTACPATAADDPGLQRIVLSIVTPSGFRQELDVLKRAN